MQVEFHVLQQAKTWTSVPFDHNMNIVINKWVFFFFRVKLKAGGSLDKRKSRLVVKGFSQTHAIDYCEIFSLVKLVTVRLILTLTPSHGWPIQQLDVSNAFLNGMLSQTVYMCHLEDFVDSQFSHHVWWLNNALYGLKQAPRA